MVHKFSLNEDLEQELLEIAYRVSELPLDLGRLEVASQHLIPGKP